MIKIHKTIKFTLDEFRHIQTIISSGLDGPHMWRKNDNNTKNLKRRICDYYLRKQGCKCIYCESILKKGYLAIEHFVPKGLHKEFTFHPKNLFISCGACNSPAIKGEKETINSPFTSKYRKNTFKIVHPFLDNPDEHLFYKDERKTMFDLARCTPKGKATISFFEWDSINAFIDRERNARSRDIPLYMNKLILEISVYR